MLFMKISYLVWMLWQLGVSVDLQWGKLKNGIYCQISLDNLFQTFAQDSAS